LSSDEVGGYSYTAFGKTLAPSDVGGMAARISQPFGWQGKRQIAPNLYDSRARIWSADLGAFLQPDEYVFLGTTGTLWSWPGQNPFRWRDPSGRLAGEEWYWVARALGPYAAPLAADIAALGLFADQVNALGAEIFAQQDANLNAIARAAARDNEGKPNPGEPCKTENSGSGAKGPPPAKGDVAAAAPDPNKGLGKAIADGHAFDKHVVEHGEFEGLGINSRDEFAEHIDGVVSNATGADVRTLSGGRTAFWDDASGTVVIRNPNAPDLGTAFRPTTGRVYFTGLR
jgi:filamentous hemagglutinin